MRVDLPSVAEELKKAGQLEEAGGGSYLARLVDFPICMDCAHYAAELRGKATKRRLIEAGNAIAKMAFSEAGSQESIDRAQQMILGLDGDAESDNFQVLSDLSMEAGDRYEKLSKNSCGLTGVPSGFVDLDCKKEIE